jgi:hypothetical protein
MGRQAKDSTLHALACKLKTPGIFTQYSALNDEANDIWHAGDLRNLQLMKDGKTFAVKLFIGDAQRIIGYSIILADACRFADLARWHFAKYRMRDRREPTESDLNFPIQQVKNDLEHEPKAMALILEIEKYLISIDVLCAETPDSAVRITERRYTVRDEFIARFAEVEKHFFNLAELMKKEFADLRAELALFKHGPFPYKRIDIVDAEIVKSERADENTAMTKVNSEWYSPEAGEVTGFALGADKSLEPFEVHIPHPRDPSMIHHTVTIQVPVRYDYENGQSILTPEAHKMIDDLKREHIAALTPIGVNPVEDIFTTTNQNPTTTQPQ